MKFGIGTAVYFDIMLTSKFFIPLWKASKDESSCFC